MSARKHRLLAVCWLVAVSACGPGGGLPTDGGGSGASGAAGSKGAGGAAGGQGAVGGGNAAGGSAGSGASTCPAAATLSCPAVDGSKALGTLSTADEQAFCGCLAAYGGGYGAPVACTCSDGSSGAPQAPPSQSACLGAQLPPSCGATVAQYIACQNLTWAKPCDSTALLAALSDPSCKALLASTCQ